MKRKRRNKKADVKSPDLEEMAEDEEDDEDEDGLSIEDMALLVKKVPAWDYKWYGRIEMKTYTGFYNDIRICLSYTTQPERSTLNDYYRIKVTLKSDEKYVLGDEMGYFDSEVASLFSKVEQEIKRKKKEKVSAIKELLKE